MIIDAREQYKEIISELNLFREIIDSSERAGDSNISEIKVEYEIVRNKLLVLKKNFKDNNDYNDDEQKEIRDIIQDSMISMNYILDILRGR